MDDRHRKNNVCASVDRICMEFSSLLSKRSLSLSKGFFVLWASENEGNIEISTERKAGRAREYGGIRLRAIVATSIK